MSPSTGRETSWPVKVKNETPAIPFTAGNCASPVTLLQSPDVFVEQAKFPVGRMTLSAAELPKAVVACA